METLQIQKASALKAYSEADDNGKQLLRTLFGNDVVGNIMDRVKTMDDVCRELGIPPGDLVITPDSNFLAGFIGNVNSYMQLLAIAKVLNEGWQPNWDGTSEYKYYPWLYMNKPGFRLSDVGCGYSGSSVGSRLCFKSSELAKYAVTQFKDVYEQFFSF